MIAPALLIGMPNLNMMKLFWTEAFGANAFSMPMSDALVRRFSVFGLIVISLEDIPQVVILFVYSTFVTGWSVTAVLSGAIAIGAVLVGALWLAVSESTCWGSHIELFVSCILYANGKCQGRRDNAFVFELKQKAPKDRVS